MKLRFIPRQEFVRNFAVHSLPWMLVLLAGCSRREYEIELKPTPEGLQRRITVTAKLTDSEGNPGPEDRAEIAQIAKSYGEKIPRTQTKQASFTGTFAGHMPQDIGGSGHFLRFKSLFGSAAGYVERFRGNDDLVAQFETHRKAVDQLVDLGIGWFESELHQEPEWPTLRQFLDGTLRHDLHNLSLYSDCGNFGLRPFLYSKGDKNDRKKDQSNEEDTARLGEFLVRPIQYLVERGYLTYEEIPSLARLMENTDRGDWSGILERLRTMILSKVKAGQPALPETKLAFLSSEQRLSDSWKKYFEGTDYFQKEKTRLQQERDQKLDKELASTRENLKEFPQALAEREKEILESRRLVGHGDVLAELYVKAFLPWLPKLFAGGDSLQVTLEAARPPVWTNGKWEADKKRVIWSESLEAPDTPAEMRFWPAMCIALWDEPNDEFQKRNFGSVILDGMNLMEFCVWYQGLQPREREEWDEFVVTLKSDDTSRQKLEGFRFANESAESAKTHPIASTGIRTMLKALRLNKE